MAVVVALFALLLVGSIVLAGKGHGNGPKPKPTPSSTIVPPPMTGPYQ